MSGNERSQATIQLAQTALMAALCYIGFQFLRIDIPIGGDKTAIHLGNAFCVLGALLLGGLKGGLAGAVGMTIADLTSGYADSAAQNLFHEVDDRSDCRAGGASCWAFVAAARAGEGFPLVLPGRVGRYGV